MNGKISYWISLGEVTKELHIHHENVGTYDIVRKATLTSLLLVKKQLQTKQLTPNKDIHISYPIPLNFKYAHPYPLTSHIKYEYLNIHIWEPNNIK